MSSITQICKVEDCGKKHHCRGYCNLHRQRLSRRGNLDTSIIRNNDIKRFFQKVDKTDTCWEWTGCISIWGYGKFYAKGKHLAAHRYSYEIHNSIKLPSRDSLMCLDHLCRNRACVNPKHLELVTLRENVVRGNVVKNRKDDLPIGIYFRVREEYRVNKPYEAKKLKNGKQCYVGNFATLEEAILAQSRY